MPSMESALITPLALVFTDVVGSSAAKRAAELGTDATARDRAYLQGIQTRYLHLVRDCVAAHNGTEIMTIGDAFFLTFEDARDALLCAAEIQIRLNSQAIMTSTGPLRVRIGIHVGRAEFFENSWHGTDVDTAARVESAGNGQQILLSAAARQAAGDLPGIRFTALGTFALKGVGDVKLWDADYDEHGPRKPQLASLESLRRQRRVKLAWRAGYAVLAVLVVLGGFYGYRKHQSNKFTEKDKIILADFDNKTGDPVFDATLKEALSIQLEQSPYLQLVGDEELHADLRYLNQPTDQRITPALARELGQREGIKAYITASVANIGTSYVVSVDAINTATGDPIARAQAESPDKNHVLTAVSTAATSLRANLGESLASIQKLSTPFMDVTTSSLDAFHAFALGDAAHSRADNGQAITYYQQAIDLDPKFAMAYARMGISYYGMGETRKSADLLNKAYALREHATERERLYITATFAMNQDDFPDGVEGYKALLNAYPNDPAALNNLGILYSLMGDNAQAVVYYKQVAENQRWDISADDNLSGSYLYLDDPANAKKYIDASAAVSTGNDSQLLANQAVYAFERGDPSWANASTTADSLSDGFNVWDTIGILFYVEGSLVQGKSEAEHAVAAAVRAKAPDVAGNALALPALYEAEYGNCPEAITLSRRALAYDASIQTLPSASMALALCGQGTQELAAMRKLAAASPLNTLLNVIWVPQTAAAIALNQHKPQQALDLLQSTQLYARASFAPYLQGQALLQLHRPAEALTALKPVFDYRFNELGNGTLPSYALSTLLAARAQAMLGNKAAAIAAYQRAIDVWKNADLTFKPLLDAKKELAALQ